MKKIGKNDDDIDMRSYREWPLFSGVRKDPLFIKTFKSAFRQPLTPVAVDFERTIDTTEAAGVTSEVINLHPARQQRTARRTKLKDAKVN